MLSLSKLPALLHLDVSHHHNSITDCALQHIGEMITLLQLDISNNNGITDKGIHHLKSLVALRQIDIGYCEQLTGSTLIYLSTLPSLNLIGNDVGTEEGSIPEEAFDVMCTFKKEWNIVNRIIFGYLGER